MIAIGGVALLGITRRKNTDWLRVVPRAKFS
jgi:hypothetical protein